MKNILKLGAIALSSMFLLTGCEEFLNRPAEDSYNAGNYYATDEACFSGVNYLYNSPWYDFQRGFIKVGEVFSGNMYWGSSPYLNFSVNGTDQDLVNMSYSLWAEISHCSTVYDAIKIADGPSQAAKNTTMGECLAWKAMAYFYLVRSFGDVPLIHNNSEELAKGEYNEMMKVQKADVYEYIIMTLEKAMELLPKSQSQAGRIDYYCAEALLAKVYLTKAGLTGSLNADDLKKAADYSKDVIDNSGRVLTPNYEDIFRGSHNTDPESLFAWRWALGAHWTCQNTLQSDLMAEGFGDQGDMWGGWGGPSIDLMNAFGVIEMERVTPDSAVIRKFPAPADRALADRDIRRRGTMMLPGDVYPYFWRDKGGFDVLRFYYDKTYNPAATEEFQGPCGCQNVKHLYGNDADHEAECGEKPARMAYAFHTHILRLADVYLINAEANVLLGNAGAAVDPFNAVHTRAGLDPVASVDFDMIWKERRLEFAGEGDRWYDFVRRSYYDADACLKEIEGQFRNNMWGQVDFYKQYFAAGAWNSDLTFDGKDGLGTLTYNNEIPVLHNLTKAIFTLPFPSEDVALNKNLLAEPIHVDVRETYKY